VNVYKLNANAEGSWAWFYLTNEMIFPHSFDERKVFFENQPKLGIVRNNDYVQKGRKEKLADFSKVNSDICFSQRAKEIFDPHINHLGQWLKLESDEAPYWAFNITNVVDAIDREKSKLDFFSSGRLMDIDEHAFHAQRLQGQLMFKIPDLNKHEYVTQPFIDLVYKHQLTGFKFLHLWCSEAGSTPLMNVKDWEKPYSTGLEPRST
jgi:hypothetical protein